MVAELRSHMPQGAKSGGCLDSNLPKSETNREESGLEEWVVMGVRVCVCVCVCAWKRDRQIDNDRGRQGGTERYGWHYLWKDLCEGILSWEAIPPKNERLGRVKYERRQKQSGGVLFSCALLWPADSGSHWALQEAILSTLEQCRRGQNWPKAPGSWWTKGCSVNFLKN